MNDNKEKNNEKGIAIILTMGILSVIFLLVLAYVNISILARKTANNYKSLQQARMFAESAYQKAIALTSTQLEILSGNAMDVRTYDGINNSHDGLPELLETIVDGVTYEDAASYTVENSAHWEYIYENGNSTDTIIGRYAYIVISEQGRIDPSASAYNAGNTATGRPGRNVDELNLNTIGSWFGNNEGELELDSPVRWNSFDSIFTALGINNDDLEDSYKTFFILNNNYDPEAFWNDNGDLQRETGELYHRFNLARTDWDNITVAKVLSEPLSFDESTSSDLIFSIPWLNNWSWSGGFPSADSNRLQVAANLIDYCDADTEASRDNDASPTYVGLEKCPYINELRLGITGSVDRVFLDPTYKYTCNVSVDTVDIEVINMYDAEFSDMTAEVFVSGSFRWKPGVSGDEEFVDFDTLSQPIDLTGITVNPKAYSEKQANPGITLFEDEREGGILERLIDCFKIKKLTVKLYWDDPAGPDSDFYDFSYVVDSDFTASREYFFENASPVYSEELLSTAKAGQTVSLYLDYQIDDPRQNLLHTDWDVPDRTDDGVDTDFFPIEPGTIGDSNVSIITLSEESNIIDLELGAENPWEISTAFIRNAPMQSPWEIGMIHRGQKWQTLNLKKYNMSEGMKGGGGAYHSDEIDGGGEYGDANILDQIKMTDDNVTYGKININTELKDVLQVLFEEIYVGSDLNTPGSTDDAIKVTDYLAKTIAVDLLAVNGLSTGSFFHTRAQILRGQDGVLSLHDNTLGLLQTTDAKQEELIGKFINLTKATPPGTYNIIIVAQAIKDIGGVTLNVDTDRDGVPDSQVSTVISDYDEDGDVILATQKIFAIGQINMDAADITESTDNNNLRILRFQYIDE